MNVWFRNDDLSRIVEFLERSRADVIVLQEVEARRLEALRAALRSYPHHVATQKARRGLVILSRTPLSGIEHFALPGRVTRIIRASVRWQGQDIAIVGTHLSWPISPGSARQRAAELRLIAQRVRREAGPVLVAGDMNMTPWSRYFERFLDQSRLGDCAHGRGLLATWPAQVPPLRIRIDHCFASPHWTVRAIDVGPQLGSDHLPVTVDLEFARRD